MKRLGVLLLLAWLAPTSALAALALEWDAPSTCPRPASLEVHAAKGLPEEASRAEVIIREKGAAWLVTVLFFEPAPGLRRVEAASCEEAQRTAGLLLELGVQNAPPPLPAPPTVAAPPATEPAPGWRVSFGAGGALDLGSLAQGEPRVVATLSAAKGLFRTALDARFGFPSALSADVQVQRLLEVQVAGCAQAELGAFAGGPCLAFAGGTWRAVSGTSTAEAFVLSTSAQLRGALLLVAGLELGAVAGLRFNLRRPAPFTEAGLVFTTPLLASELQLTLGWRFE
jgi:hypothetical protein